MKKNCKRITGIIITIAMVLSLFPAMTVPASAAEAPTVTGISPTSGSSSGGTTVTITGTNFDGATSVKFGTESATTIESKSSTQIVATSPAHSDGTVDVTVTTAGGTSATSEADQFTYVSVPEIDVKGNDVSIASGDTTPASSDYTDFGSTAVADGTVERTFTIYNTGLTSLNLSGTPKISISGTNVSNFTVTTEPPSASVAAGGTTTFKIVFDPSDAGNRKATVSIANDDSDENPYTFSIQGTGLSSDAGLMGVAGMADITPGTQTGADASNAIAWEVSVANSKSVLSLSDIVAAGAGGKLYSNADFTSEITAADTLPLVAGGKTTAYISVTAEDGTTIKYYAVEITRAAAPVLTTNAGLTINEGQADIVITNTTLQTTDSDTAAASLTYTVITDPACGTLKKNGVGLSAGSTFTQDDIDKNLITYTHNGIEITADSFTFKVSDGANEITGQTFSIIVTPVNDAPAALATALNPTFTEGGAPVSLFKAVGVSTIEGGQKITSLTFNVIGVSDDNPSDIKEFLNIDGLKVALSNGNSVTGNFTCHVSVSGNVATVTVTKASGATSSSIFTLINSVTYQNDSANPTVFPRTVVLTSISDNGGTANGGVDTTALSISSIVTISPVNSAPVVSSGAGTPVYTENASGIAIDDGITVADADNATLAAAVVSITAGFKPGDVLTFTNDDVSMYGNISASYNSSTGVMTLTSAGATATKAQWQAALRTLTFMSTSDNPGTSRTVSFMVKDSGGAESMVAAKNINVTPVNDAPTDIELSNSSVSIGDIGINIFIGTLSSTDADSYFFAYTIQSVSKGGIDLTSNLFDISGDILRAANPSTLAAGTYSVTIRSSEGDGGTYDKTFSITVSNKPAKTLTPDTVNNNVDNDIEITFAADPVFAAAISGVSFNGHVLENDQYTVSNDRITLKPGSNANSYLRTPVTGNVVISAAGYDDSSISQTITAGVVDSLEVTVQPVPGAENGDVFTTQPVVRLKDQYGNVCTDGPSANAVVTASATASTGTWTLGGTITKAASSGIADFNGNNMTCTLVTLGNGKMTFSCGSKMVESSTFIIPERNSSITPTTAAFDKYTSATNYKDLTVTLILNGNTLNSIKNGADTLVLNTDYTTSGNTITIKKEYLKNLSAGTVNLTFDFSLGTDRTLAVTVSDSTTSGGGTTPSSGGSTPAKTDSSTSTVVVVDGQKQDAGEKKTETADNGMTQTTVTVDDTKLNKILDTSGEKPIVTLAISEKTDVVVGELNGQTVKNMERKEATLEIRTDTITYTLPVSQINIDAVSSQIGSQVELKDIKVNVKIAEPPADTVRVVEDTANKNSYQIVVKPIEFEITCTSGSKTVIVSRFNGYVERTIAIPDGVDPSKITTGIVLNTDGTFRHVPTQIVVINGKYFAKINSLTNSTYSVIWNPVTFTDVENHWAKNAVNDMGSRMVVTGVGSGRYEPGRNITRAEFAAVVMRAIGLAKGTAKSSFSDVSLSDWFNGYVGIAAEYGLIAGYSKAAYGPNDTITREQAMAILARAMKTTGLEVSLTDGEINTLLAKCKDGADVSGYAREAAAACIKSGVVAGSSVDLLSPKAYVSRAEVAVMVQRLLQKSGLI